MKPEWRRFAVFGLYLALLAALVALGLFIIQREWNLYLQISLAIILLGLGIFALLDPQRVRAALTGRQAKYGSNALVLTIACIGILVVINYVVSQNSKRWDLTEDQNFTLAPETLETLKSLPAPVKANAFFTGNMNSETARSLLEQYQFYSEGNLDYEFIDPDSNPVAAENAKITRDGTIVLVMGENQEQVTISSEQELTGALVRLINPVKSKVYFLTGHGEYSPEDTGDQSYALVKRTLEGKNYLVETLNLLATSTIPEDAEVIVIGGPREAMSQGEIELLTEYVNSAGGLVVMLEPVMLTEMEDADNPLEAYLNQTWGIGFQEDIVVDPTSGQAFAPYAAQYGSHPITEKIQRVTSQYPSTRSIVSELQTPGTSQVQLVLTAPQAWAETDLEGLNANPPQIAFTEGEDQAGPISIAVAAENFESEGKVVVYGDADFVTDGNFFAFANSDIFVNSVDWAAGKEEIISLTPKSNTQRVLVPPQKTVMNLIFLVVVVLMPALGLIGGVIVWTQKRRRG